MKSYLYILLISAATFHLAASQLDEDSDCIHFPVNGSSGKVQVNDTISCYVISISNVTGSVYLAVDPYNDLPGGSNITVYNIFNTTPVLVSNRTVDHNGGYGVVAYSNSTNSSSEVVRVELHFNRTVLEFKEIVVFTYTNSSCSIPLRSTAPSLSSPDYTPGISMTITCQYIFEHHGGADMMYAFTQFSISSNAYVKFSGDENRYQGKDLPPDFKAFGKTMSFSLNVSNNDNFRAARLTPTEECSKLFVLDHSTPTLNISSPGFPEPYGNNLDCKMIIRSDNSSRYLMFTIIEFSLADDADNLQLIDGGASRSDPTHVIAGLRTQAMGFKNVPLVSSSGTVLVRFKTDELGTSNGFSIRVDLSDTSKLVHVSENVHFAPTSNQSSTATFLIQTTHGKQVLLKPAESGISLIPPAFVSCYDYSVKDDRLSLNPVAFYRSDYLTLPAYSLGSRMLCRAFHFHVNSDVFTATTESVSAGHSNQFSYSSSGVYSVSIPTDKTNSTYDWLIQPDDYDDNSVIELVVGGIYQELSSPVTITVTSMKARSYAEITEHSIFPYVLRAPASDGLRLFVNAGANSSDSSTLYYFDNDPTQIRITASYSMQSVQTDISDESGMVSSPHYPTGTVQQANKIWMFEMSNETVMALYIAFEPLFELSSDSQLVVSTISAENGTRNVLLNMTGPVKDAPSDLVIPSIDVSTVELSFTSQHVSRSAGFKLNYTTISDGAMLNLEDTGGKAHLQTPTNITAPYQSVFIISCPGFESGHVLKISGKSDFQPNNSTQLILRDGSSSFSPLVIAINEFETTSRYLYVEYIFMDAMGQEQEAAPLSIAVAQSECDMKSQCVNRHNVTICMPPTWICDGIYQCLDGSDETDCKKPTPSPAVTEEGAKWWVFGVCITVAFIIGIVAGVACVALIMRRRATGYNRLSEFMAPVPT